MYMTLLCIFNIDTCTGYRHMCIYFCVWSNFYEKYFNIIYYKILLYYGFQKKKLSYCYN